MGLGLYAGVSWAHALRLRDRASFALMFEARAPRLAALGFACIAAVGYGVNFWAAPFFIRVHAMDRAQAGLVLGGTDAIAGWIGVTCGGLLADRWRRRASAGRPYTTMLARACRSCSPSHLSPVARRGDRVLRDLVGARVGAGPRS
jgi:hypothetical protein